MKVMMVAAIAMPRRIAREAFLISILSSEAASAPVHPPVPGSGMPTNSVSPQNSAF